MDIGTRSKGDNYTMITNDLMARRYVIQDIVIFEIFNPDEKIWEYYVQRKNDADMQFSFGVENRLAPNALRELWLNGYFDEE